MLVAHASDTHDRPSLVRNIRDSRAEVLILTGDCMNNAGRKPGNGYRINPAAEVKYQNSWSRKQAKKAAVTFKIPELADEEDDTKRSAPTTLKASAKAVAKAPLVAQGPPAKARSSANRPSHTARTGNVTKEDGATKVPPGKESTAAEIVSPTPEKTLPEQGTPPASAQSRGTNGKLKLYTFAICISGSQPYFVWPHPNFTLLCLN